jgi:hypothetical protein
MRVTEKDVMKQLLCLGRASYVLIYAFFIISCSEKNMSNSDPNERGSMDQIRKDTELLIAGAVTPKQFAIKNPEYNPRWFAKLAIDKSDVPSFEKELRSKRLLNMTRSSPPSQSVDWWTPSNDADKYTFMTSVNAPVTVILSPTETNVEIFIWWSSP